MYVCMYIYVYVYIYIYIYTCTVCSKDVLPAMGRKGTFPKAVFSLKVILH